MRADDIPEHLWRHPLKPRFGPVARTLTATACLCAAGVAQAQGLVDVVPLKALAGSGLSLHHGLLLVCVAIFVLVFGLMFVSVVRHRLQAGATQTHFHASLVVEIVWTLVPFLIVSGMGFASIKGVMA
jgi:heme/copper-type cytochrome/quinol oxidase subunit 2